jgi:hypothetical protein
MPFGRCVTRPHELAFIPILTRGTVTEGSRRSDIGAHDVFTLALALTVQRSAVRNAESVVRSSSWRSVRSVRKKWFGRRGAVSVDDHCSPVAFDVKHSLR